MHSHLRGGGHEERQRTFQESVRLGLRRGNLEVVVVVGVVVYRPVCIGRGLVATAVKAGVLAAILDPVTFLALLIFLAHRGVCLYTSQTATGHGKSAQNKCYQISSV